MVVATRAMIRRAVCPVGLALAALLLQPGPGPAQAPVPEDGLFITLPNPLSGEAVKRIKATTERALQRTDRHIRKIVYDFNPNGRPSETTDYGPCRDLADFLLEVQNATTVAFVRNEVTGHTVLPVLACKEIVMAPDAKLGDVLRDQPRPLRNDQVQFYEDVAVGRGRCPAIVRKMLDKDVAVLEGTRRGGVWYIDRRREKDEVQQGFVPTQREPVLPAGDIGLYNAAQAQRFGLCNLIKETRQEVAEAYQLTPSSLREDPLEGREPVAELISVREPFSRALRETLERRIRQAMGRRANLIFLRLEGGGGDTAEARTFAEFLRGLKDDLPVMTVAYIPRQAPGAMTFVAFGCTEIVMAKEAELGDFEAIVYQRSGPRRIDFPARWRAVEESLAGLAQEQGYPPLVAQGMLDPSVTIYRVQSQKGAPEWRLITEEELQKDQAGPRKWGHKKLIKPGGRDGRLLKLSAQEAKELGVAREVVNDWPDVCNLYGLERERVREAGSDFLYELAVFLRHPLVSVFLVMIGIACLILELKMPGIGLPGVIAALCFVLYFWAHSQLAGQIIMLAILLFLLGLILIGVEIFLLPGSAVMGISGIVLVIVSLGLATLEKKPETTQEWISFGQTLGGVGLGLLGAILLAFVLAWYLPSMPYASRLVLKPPHEPGEFVEGEDPATAGLGQPETAALLGAIGVAATPLRPAGIARFGEDFVDVVTEGGYVPAGNRVQVIEIEGYRIVVKEV